MQGIVQFLPLLLVLVVFYALMIVPESKRKKKYNQMIEGLKVNDEVLTRGGIMGKIVTIKDDYVILESGPDKSRIKLVKTGIGSLVEKVEETEK